MIRTRRALTQSRHSHSPNHANHHRPPSTRAHGEHGEHASTASTAHLYKMHRREVEETSVRSQHRRVEVARLAEIIADAPLGEPFGPLEELRDGVRRARHDASLEQVGDAGLGLLVELPDRELALLRV